MSKKQIILYWIIFFMWGASLFIWFKMYPYGWGKVEFLQGSIFWAIFTALAHFSLYKRERQHSVWALKNMEPVLKLINQKEFTKALTAIEKLENKTVTRGEGKAIQVLKSTCIHRLMIIMSQEVQRAARDKDSKRTKELVQRFIEFNIKHTILLDVEPSIMKGFVEEVTRGMKESLTIDAFRTRYKNRAKELSHDKWSRETLEALVDAASLSLL